MECPNCNMLREVFVLGINMGCHIAMDIIADETNGAELPIGEHVRLHRINDKILKVWGSPEKNLKPFFEKMKCAEHSKAKRAK